MSTPAADPSAAGVPATRAFRARVGQEPVVEQLSRAVAAAHDPGSGASGMTHAWLFTGPPGSGRSVAPRQRPAPRLSPRHGGGECPACRQVAVGSHADLLLVRPDGLSYGVRQTRDLVLKAATAPVNGRWRVILFEGADRGTEQAANALLKAIEEPAPRTVWLLCAPCAVDLPTSIRSRCRLVTLRTPPTEAVAAVLQAEGVGAQEALDAARAARGPTRR